MATTVSSVVLVRRPVEDVFAYVLDLEQNGPEWAPDLKSVEKTSEGPVGAGTTFNQQQEVMGRSRETTLTFVDVQLNRQIDAEADIGVAAPRASLVFRPEEGATRLTLSADLNPRGLGKLLAPMMRRQGQKMWDARLATLKRVLEAKEPQESSSPSGD